MVTSDRPGGRPLCRDAERNRQRILTAAARLIAEHGLGVSHDQIAQAAEVAVGTVYHRFPDKSSLIEALFADQVDAVVASARAALHIADPWTAPFMPDILAMLAANRGLRELSGGSSIAGERARLSWRRAVSEAGRPPERAPDGAAGAGRRTPAGPPTAPPS